MVSFYFYCKEVNILYCFAFKWPTEWLFYSLNCFKVELFVVKICIICAQCACWFDNVSDPLCSV